MDFMNKVNAYVLENFIKKTYKKISETEGVEEIYYQRNKLAIFIKDSVIGKRIYDLIIDFSENDKSIKNNVGSISINKFYANERKEIEIILLDFVVSQSVLKNESGVEKILGLVEFIYSMRNKYGYNLDDSTFNKEMPNSLSALLSLFKFNTFKDLNQVDGTIIKLIHSYYTNGGNFEEFYKEKEKKGICSITEFPYKLPIIRMCYEFFQTGTFFSNLRFVLEIENSCDYEENYLIMLNKNNFESNSKVIEYTSQCTTYDNNIKLFNNKSYELKLFESKSLIDESNEKIHSIIIDLDRTVAHGYVYEKNNLEITEKSISEIAFKNQKDIITFFIGLDDYLSSVKATAVMNSGRLRLADNNSVYGSKINFDNYLDFIIDSEGQYQFKFKQIDKLFSLISRSNSYLKSSMTDLFFNILQKFIKEKYGIFKKSGEFLKCKEVKYLPPILAREFINYSLNKRIDYCLAEKSFYEFIRSNYMKNDFITSDSEEACFFYSKFEYNPEKVPFLFYDEAKEKYGRLGSRHYFSDTVKLEDGRTFISVNGVQTISKIKKVDSSIRSEISEKFEDFVDNNHIKLAGISEIIYSNNYIDDNEMYEVKGYIIENYKGKALTDKFLMSLNNKEFLKVAGYIFTNFNNYYIPLDYIYMDNDVFYIAINEVISSYSSIFQTHFIETSKCQKGESFTQYIIKHLISIGANVNNFANFDYTTHYYDKSDKNVLLNLADSLDTVCKNHNIFYDSALESCPICIGEKHTISEDTIKTLKKVFEDDYANHYILNNKYNIKVYKQLSKKTISLLEKNVEQLIRAGKAECYQECFIPKKKLLNNNNEFIGYVYESVDFNECINIKDLQKLNNLARIKCLIRLINQVEKTFGYSSELYFVENPYSDVFLIKNYKRQVQILNIDFLSKNISKKFNLNNSSVWLAEYVKNIVDSDKFINLKISEYTKLYDILKNLTSLANELTKYCPTHKIYYSKNEIFCPICCESDKFKKIPIITERKKDIESWNSKFNDGGESIIYNDYDEEYLIKLFKENEVDMNVKTMIIAKILSKKEILDNINKDSNLNYKYVFLKKLLIDRDTNKIIGYYMDKIVGVQISSLRDKEEVKNLGLTRKDVLEILITLGEGIETLHKKANIYIGDLNGRNILFNSKKQVFFIDFDGMGIDDIKPSFCTDGYIDPISKKSNNITMEDDWYSFAIQAFYYLTYTHPFNGIYYEEGRQLEITEKMERKISLLGNHDMKVPAIAEPWHWMSKELKEAFLSIFEGNNRESIVPHLIRQYEKLISLSESEEIIRINDKFIAKKVDYFFHNIKYFINPYVTVCSEGSDEYIVISLNNGIDFKSILLPDSHRTGIKKVLLSNDEKLAFVVFEKEVLVFDLEENKLIYTKKVNDYKDLVINDKTLFINKTIGKRGILIEEKNLETNKSIFHDHSKVKHFWIDSNYDYLMIKNPSSRCMIDEIHLKRGVKEDSICSILRHSKDTIYNVLFDETFKLFLVVNTEGNGFIINQKKGSYVKIDLKGYINNINIENIVFDKEKIYIPDENCLNIISAYNHFETKTLKCDLIKSNSQIFDITSDGFSVLNFNDCYQIRRE